jgi:hypothetical protein
MEEDKVVVTKKIEIVEELFTLDSADVLDNEQVMKLSDWIESIKKERGLCVPYGAQDEVEALKIENAEMDEYIKSLQIEIADLVAKPKNLDQVPIVDNNNNNEAEIIEDPTLLNISDKEENLTITKENDDTIIIDRKALENIRDTFVSIRLSYGIDAANQYLNNLKAKGIIPKDIN